MRGFESDSWLCEILKDPPETKNRWKVGICCQPARMEVESVLTPASESAYTNNLVEIKDIMKYTIFFC